MRKLSLLGILGSFVLASSAWAGGSVIINEVDADTPGSDVAEFVELYDGGGGNTDLTGLVLVLINGSDDKSYRSYDLDGFSTNAQGYFVLCGNGFNVANCDLVVEPAGNLIQNGADAVALYTGDAVDWPNDTPLTTDNLLDAIVYDTDDGDDAALLVLLNAAQPQVNERDGGSGTTHSNQRCPNGSGGARNTDTYTQFISTPGRENCVEPGPDVRFNEINADPLNAVGGDANGDGADGGVGHFSDDEFIEIFNNSGGDLDMSGWEFQDNGVTRHVFPPGTVVADQCAIVVFGGGTPEGGFGGALVQVSSTGTVDLSNGGATLSLVDAGAVEVVIETYDGDDPDTGENTSITRDPDIAGPFVQHITATGSGGALFSPGTMIDGTAFSGCEAPDPACGDSNAGDCFEDNGSPFCSDGECCDAVCLFDPFCCGADDGDWNAACAQTALVECRSCGDPATGDCFDDNGTPYCKDASCCETVCGLNPSCCSGPWNQACANMALDNCPFNSPECGDLVFGLSNSDGAASLELVRGPAVENGGAQIDDFWDGPFIQSVELDNLGELNHNPLGNLLGVNFGSSASGGSISSFATCSPPGGGDLIGNTLGLGGDLPSICGSGGDESCRTRLGGLSVSPDNDKIAVTGFDNGAVIVYDYVAGDCSGNGASLSNARQTDPGTLCTFSTQGTAWKDNNTVLAFSANGDIFAIDDESMDPDLITTVDTVGCGGFTDIEFAPDISDNVYAMYSRFTGGTTTNLLFVLDPSDNLALLGVFNYSVSMNTTREIAFDVDGNLYTSQFPGAIDVILDAANLGSLADDVSTDWYTSGTFASFSGIDVAQCLIEVPLDIKPGSCPNPMNTHSNGVVPVSVLGTDTFDASEIVISSVQICRADGVGSCVSPNEGPPGPHSVLDDTGTPFEGELCSCHDLTGDGLIDLSLKFRTQNMVAAMQLDSEPGGTFIEMVVTGSLLNGTQFNASDCVLIVPPNSGQTSATMQSNVADTFIEVTPLDLTVDSDGFANFSRSYVSGTIVTVTAPTTSQGRRFLRWSVDSVLQPVGVRTMEITMGENATLKALYQRPNRVRPSRPTAPAGDQD